MEIIDHLALGFSTALTYENLWYCALGCFIGTFIGMMPGLGPTTTISLLLPIVYSMPTVGSFIMLAGIYYGAQFGDSVSAITMKIPHAGSIITCIDGYQMHLQKRTGLALFTAGVSSFIGGTIATVLVAAAAPPLSELAFMFGPAEYAMLMILGFVCVSLITTGSLINGLGMVVVGVLLGSVGTDINSGQIRFTADITSLVDGISIISIAIGCFGLAEITKKLNENNTYTPFSGSLKLLPSWADFKRLIPSALRGSAVGSALGLIPGGGPTIAQFGAYAVEKKFSKHNHEIGSGSIEGVAGPCASDEAASKTGFIPLMSLGIPENAVMALLLGALMIKGLTPGPQMITNRPDLFWGLVASMWIGNIFLLILNVPLVKFWLSLFKVPHYYLYPTILFFCCIGTYSINNDINHVYITAFFGVLGYMFVQLKLEAAPLMLGFILGPMLEEHVTRQLNIGRGDFTTFFESSLSQGLCAIIVSIVLYTLAKTVKNTWLTNKS